MAAVNALQKTASATHGSQNFALRAPKDLRHPPPNRPTLPDESRDPFSDVHPRHSGGGVATQWRRELAAAVAPLGLKGKGRTCVIWAVAMLRKQG